MSDLESKLQKKLQRRRTVHDELITPVTPEVDVEPENEVREHASSETNHQPEAVDAPKRRGQGRPKQLKAKVTTLYFDEDLDRSLEFYLMRQYMEKHKKISKSEWIRSLVEAKLRELGEITD